jgi:hypothetical protein
MPHVVLLGDSIFDNSNYVHPAPDVVSQFRELLPAGWKATLRAVDGAVTNDVAKQLSDLPGDATHLVLSVGGNDLLGWAGDLLLTSAGTSSDAFQPLARLKGVFESMYRRALDTCLTPGLPLVVCTIYEGNFADVELQTTARVAVGAFNDSIVRLSLEKGLRAIDLWSVCKLPEDYANAIEPSAIGGSKIARAIWQAISSTN